MPAPEISSCFMKANSLWVFSSSFTWFRRECVGAIAPPEMISKARRWRGDEPENMSSRSSRRVRRKTSTLRPSTYLVATDVFPGLAKSGTITAQSCSVSSAMACWMKSSVGSKEKFLPQENLARICSIVSVSTMP